MGHLYFNGDIYTVDDRYPSVEAVAVSGGRILAVGSESECRAALGDDFEPVDLEGRALLPGFIDTHIHPIMMIYFDMNLDLRHVTSMGDLIEEIARVAEGSPRDSWVIGLRFDEENLKEPRLPTRHDLDSACSDRPVVIIKHDGHMAIGNTRAIEAVGVSSSTRDPEGGVIDREPDGCPAGPFREAAGMILKDAIPLPDMNSFVAGIPVTFDRIAAQGITSVGAVLQTGEEGPAGASGSYDVPIMQLFEGSIPVNLYSLLITDEVETIRDAMKASLHREGGPGPGRRIGGIKIFSDGTLGSHTALLRNPYSDEPDKQGFLTLKPEEIYRRMAEAHRAGLQIAIHSIGDGACRLCVDLFDRLLKEYPREDHRHRLEHAVVLDPELISDMARLGLVVSTTPMYMPSERKWLHKRLGQERGKWTYPFRSLIDAGVKVAGSSDAPVESISVLEAIECSITRDGFEPQQRITAAEAIRMFTIDAAFSQFEDEVKGSITVGKRADMVILSENPASAPTESISGIQVERTIVGGEVVFQH